jgi:hypothetical protein
LQIGKASCWATALVALAITNVEARTALEASEESRMIQMYSEKSLDR